MANKPLKSIKFPGLSDTYTVPEVDSTLTGSGKAADAKVVGDQLGDLKSAFGFVDENFEVGFNQFDGRYNSGYAWAESGAATKVAQPGYVCTELIPAGNTGHLRFRANQQPYSIVVYNSNKEYVRKSNYYAYAVAIEQGGYVGFTFQEANFNADTLMVAYTDETSGATTDKWDTLFPGIGYVPYELTPKLANNVESVNNLALTAYPDYFTNSKMANTVYADCDTIPPQTIVLYSGATNLSHRPSGFTDGYIVTLNYKGTSNGGNENFSVQYAHACGDGQNTIWYRSKYATWTDWATVTTESAIITNAYRGLKNYTVLGDSISVGLSYTSMSQYHQVKSWATIMADSMNVTADIYAEGGRTTAQMLAASNYADAVANANGNQFAVIALGINDMNKSVDSTTFKANYTQLVNDMLTHHDFVLCLTIPEGLQGAGRSAYNNDIADVAGAITNAFVVDVNAYSGQIAPLCYLGHMSSIGYAALASFVARAIDDVVARNDYFLHGIVDE